jgi:hypothetical protein
MPALIWLEDDPEIAVRYMELDLRGSSWAMMVSVSILPALRRRRASRMSQERESNHLIGT